ncbi:NH(3)-dependent NAD(+) synthetase [compost metagenome]
MRPIQQQIIRELHVLSQIDPALEFRVRVSFLKKYLKDSGLKVLILGISGGQDSTLTGKIAQTAINELKEEMEDQNYRFVAVRLPYGVQKDEDDAQLALEFIVPDKVITFNIQSAVDSMVNEFLISMGKFPRDFDKGNVKARIRMVAQYFLEAEAGALVLGTDHAAEAVTGFFTKYGDGAVDVTPLTGLNKRQGKQILKYLGAPERLYLKAPTADLLDTNVGQPDETELGITYDQLDDYLEGKDVEDEIAEKIEKRYILTEHKRQLPATPHDIKIK